MESYRRLNWLFVLLILMICGCGGGGSPVSPIPTIAIDNAPSQDVNGNSYTFEWTATDDVDAPSAMSYDVELDGVWQGWQVGISSYAWTSLSSGSHTFKAKVRDTGTPAQTAEVSCNFTVNFQPSVTIDDCPTDIQPATVTLNWTGTDDLSDEAEMSYSYRVGSDAWSAWQVGQLSATLENLGENEQTVYVRVRDTGNPPLTCETAPETCDSCTFIVDTDCTEAPADVANFGASDALASLAQREVSLTWDPIVTTCATYYDVERRDYDWTSGWGWVQVDSVPHPQSSWTDTDARYCGSGNPIQYRIRPRNTAGTSPSYASDTGYPIMRQVKLAMWCAADNASGDNATTSWTRAMDDYQDCNSFWHRFGIDFVLENPGGFQWMTNPAYRHVTGDEDWDMHQEFGQISCIDCINVYFIESADGSYTDGYCSTWCPGNYHNTENIYVVLCKDARGASPNIDYHALPHELGHAVGRFEDVYLLDGDANLVLDDGLTCADFDWCSIPPDVPPLFCDINACYPQEPNAWNKTPRQLMWWGFLGQPISEYDLYETQWIWLDEWLHGHEDQYPAP